MVVSVFPVILEGDFLLFIFSSDLGNWFGIYMTKFLAALLSFQTWIAFILRIGWDRRLLVIEGVPFVRFIGLKILSHRRGVFEARSFSAVVVPTVIHLLIPLFPAVSMASRWWSWCSVFIFFIKGPRIVVASIQRSFLSLMQVVFVVERLIVGDRHIIVQSPPISVYLLHVSLQVILLLHLFQHVIPVCVPLLCLLHIELVIVWRVLLPPII